MKQFTRDEAIAVIAERLPSGPAVLEPQFRAGIRFALEALTAASAFSDCGPECSSRLVCAKAMSDKLDAAGIR